MTTIRFIDKEAVLFPTRRTPRLQADPPRKTGMPLWTKIIFGCFALKLIAVAGAAGAGH
jgi:hypothetical protein